MVERIEGLLSRIPGYDAYNKKELMRDDDRRLREQIASRIDGAVSDLTAISRMLADKRELDTIGAVEDLVRDTRLLSDRLRTATYGYDGLFSGRAIDEFALGQLKAFDVAFDARVDAMVEKIRTIGSEGEALESQIRDVGVMVDSLDRLFNARNDVITTASPTSDPNVLNLLETPVTLSAKEEQLLRVKSGGALAILGDNYHVGAHIAVKDRDDKVMVSLLRLDAGPDWIAVVRHDRITCWRVQESAVADVQVRGSAGSATVSGPAGTQRDLPATYDVQESGHPDSLSVVIVMALAGEARAYSGAQIPLMDVEVYSEGTTT